MTSVAVPPAAAWVFPQPEGEIWAPSNTPLGDGTPSVKGTNVAPPINNATAQASDWIPQVAVPVTPGTATVQLGINGTEAKAARAATGGASSASAGSALAQAGTLPVAVAPAPERGEAAQAVTVEVTDPAKGQAAGASGPLVALSDADSSAGGIGRQAKVTLDLKNLQAAGWADRARLVALPACSLTTPQLPECRIKTPVASTVDTTGHITADITLPNGGTEQASSPATQSSTVTTAVKASYTTTGTPLLTQASAGSTSAPMVLSAEPSPSGAGGSYAATSLAPSTAWSSGSNAGNFNYSYPIQVPAALGGSSPAISLGYNSAAVDGKTSATNSQSSWIGDGWNYEPGFIERSYKNCDKAGITGSADLCWGGQNASLSLAGHSGTLVRDDALGVWHLQDDDGTKVEKLTGAPRAVGDQDYRDMEYWRITTPDGTEYYFGRNHLPGGDGTDKAANSVLTAPVYSPTGGATPDPCYNSSTGSSSWCQMAWRWQLDYVVDTHGDLTTYKYATEGNKYSRGGAQSHGNGTTTDYQRAGYLTEIGYGQRLDEQKTAKGTLNPAAKVLFTTAERCKAAGAITCDESQRTTANADAWPDVPIDQICTTTCTTSAPTFFTTKRLSSITTQVLVNSAFTTVDSWALSQSLEDPGDGTKRTLQLNSVTRTGSNGQTPITLPAVTFGYSMMANRVDGLVPAAPMFNRPRIREIGTETGGRINVVYSAPECSRVASHMPSSEDGNTMACMPVKWYLPGQSSPDPVNDWFNKPIVRTVTEQDLVSSPSVNKVTEYTYNGGTAWHRNDAEFTDPKTRTWSDFRGYQSVTTSTGSASAGEAPKTQQRVTYLRGMDGDYKANGTQPSVAVPNPLGGADLTDSDWLAGRVVATEVFDQAGGTVRAITGSTYGGQQVTATHVQTAGALKIYARYPDATVAAVSKAKLANGTWRTTTAGATTDPGHGNRVIQANDKGDGTTATPETCTTTNYATSTNTQLLTLVSQQITIQGPCGTTPTTANTISGTRTLYDGLPFGQAGSVGNPTSSQVLDRYDTGNKPVYAQAGSASFDIYGRNLTSASTDGSTYDSTGSQLTGPSVTPATSSVALTPTVGALATQSRTTGPLGAGWTSTVTQDPGRGVPLTTQDVNGRTTTLHYDALGRLTDVWSPDRPTSEKPGQKFTYAVNGFSAPSTTTTEWLQEGGQTYSAQIDIVDGLGRPRQTQRTSDAKPTGRLITDTAYDSHGWAIKASAPYYEQNSLPSTGIFAPANDGQVPAQTWTSYDGQGRAVRAEFRSYGNLQWATNTAYAGADRTDVTPPSGGTPTSTVTDARSNTTATWQYRTPTATGNPADADITTYKFTPAGQTKSHTDSAGNTWSYTYDLRGRQTSANDPDVGISNTFYDANSRIDHTTDAKGNTLAYSYDLLGRKTGLYNGSVSPANQLASWTFDTLAKNQPTSSTRYVGGATGAAYTKAVTGYDTAYRPLGSAITIPAAEGALAGTYTTSNTYSPVLGSLKQLSLPAAGGLPAENVSYGYTVTGVLTTSASLSKPIVAAMAYDALARPVRTTVGEYGKQVVSTQQYDWATGRVINSFVDRQVGTVSVDQTTYTYTPTGRITSASNRQDATATDTQCYAYDYLGRLTGAWTDTGGTFSTADWTDSSGETHGTGSSTTVPGIGGCNNATAPGTTGPGTRTVGGPAPYWNTYTYDATGNRTGLTQHDITGNTSQDITTTQTFGPANSVNTPTSAPNTGGGTGGPHALLTSTTTSSTGTKALSYQYDAKGNTTAITDTGGTTALTWNGEDKPTSLTKTGQAGATTYLYDADGNQLLRRNPGQTTLNVLTDELTLDTATGFTSNTRSISAPGGLTYTRVTAAIGGGKVLIQASDPHGTNNLQINTTTAQPVTRRPVDPFGNPRGTQPAASAWAGKKGFVGGSKDDTTGLTSLGARQYDPTTGRFISTDPLLDAGDPQQWNAYAYANNDPVNNADPNGLMCAHGAPGGGPDGRCAGAPNDTDGVVGDNSNNCAVASCQKGAAEMEIAAFVAGRWNTDPRGNYYGPTRPTIKPTGGFKETIAGMGRSIASTVDSAPNISPACWIEDCSPNLAGKYDGLMSSIGVDTNSDAYSGGETLADVLSLVSAARGAAEAASLLKRFLKGCHSFPEGTLVLLGDGNTKRIDELAVGDLVLATDPQTGKTVVRAVEDTITTPNDTEFTTVTLEGDGNQITATDHHPFWSPSTGRWIEAAALQAGMSVLTSNGSALTVTDVRHFQKSQPAYDLTIADLHTYYVLAGVEPVLVHNCDVALGMKAEGTYSWAKSKNFEQFGDLPADGWQGPVQSAIRDPSVQLHINMKGMGNFINSAKAGLAPGPFATDEEMGWIARAVANGERSWSSISFYRPNSKGVLEIYDVPEPDWSDFGRLRPFSLDADKFCGC